MCSNVGVKKQIKMRPFIECITLQLVAITFSRIFEWYKTVTFKDRTLTYFCTDTSIRAVPFNKGLFLPLLLYVDLDRKVLLARFGECKAFWHGQHKNIENFPKRMQELRLRQNEENLLPKTSLLASSTSLQEFS